MNVSHPRRRRTFFTRVFAGVPANGSRPPPRAAPTRGCTLFGSTSEFARALAATTAVTLVSFTATGRDRAVDLAWATASELQNMGFNLYRSNAEAGPYTRITKSLIPGLGSSPTGQSYSYRDAGLVNGRTYFYKLEDVETTGRTALHGPVSATPDPSSPDMAPPPPSPGSPGTAYGDPRSVVLREIERSARARGAGASHRRVLRGVDAGRTGALEHSRLRERERTGRAVAPHAAGARGGRGGSEGRARLGQRR